MLLHASLHAVFLLGAIGCGSLFLPSATTTPALQPASGTLQHYVYFNISRERIREPWFLGMRSIRGAQLKYRWRELEPERDRYDFSTIRSDLEFLRRNDKRLFIQLQDVSFDSSIVNVPQYILTDSAYHGGAVRDRGEGGQLGGWVPRRWDPAVRARFQKLIAALGAELDGQIEGINLPETAIGVDSTDYPSGFTPDRYRAGILENMRALKRAFPRSVAMQYGNFMPGEWLPGVDRGHLRTVYQEARDLGIAMGAPDLLPHRRGQQNHTYAMMRQYRGDAPLGIAIQEGNLEAINPKTGARVTVSELVEFASSQLKVTYMFWEPQEPYFTNDVVPFLKALPDSR